MFELKYEVFNDTKEAEYGIEFVHNINKIYALCNIVYVYFRLSYFSEMGAIQWNTIYSEETFWFITSGNIFIFVYFREYQIAFKLLSQISFLD